MMHKNTILAMLLIASPILFVFVAFSDTFSMSWNQGRGGFLFGRAFIVAEIVGIKFVVVDGFTHNNFKKPANMS